MNLNYLAEVIAFEQWVETHYLQNLSQLIWYKLMNLGNKSGWSEWVVVDNQRLMAAVQTRREAKFIEARDDLIKADLIEFRKGYKGKPSQYRMKSVREKLTFKYEVNNEVNHVVNQAVKTEVDHEDIYKLNKNKLNYTPKPPAGDEQQKSNLDQYNSFMKSEFDFDDLEKRLTGN